MRAPRDVPPVDSESEEPRLRSRTSEKEERKASESALSELCKRMIALGAAKLGFLELDPEMLEVIEGARKITSAPALARQVKRLRGLLRDADWALYLRKLDAKSAGIAFEEDPAAAETIRWATELPIQGDRGLGRFLELYPNGDRTRLRQLLVNVARAPEAKRTKARRQLEMLVEATIRESERDAERRARAEARRNAPQEDPRSGRDRDEPLEDDEEPELHRFEEAFGDDE